MAEKLSTEEFYSAGEKEGKLLGLCCENGHITLPPRHSCLTCKSHNLTAVELSGLGRLVEFTEVHAKSKDFPLDTPYMLALVRLDEGPNLLGIIDGVHTVTNARCKVTFKIVDEIKGKPRIFFRSVND